MAQRRARHAPDATRTAPSAAPGRDILIGNTGGDRLIDWIGEFNSYIVPFAPFGIATVSRQVPPALFEFLYALSKAQGADPTRAADTNIASAPRNGEPYGEIGLITQQDHGLWQDQTGGPTDPQAGNIPGGKRDVLRTANFNDGTLTGFAPDSGVWEVSGGALQRLGGLARQGRGRRLLRRPDAAGLLRARSRQVLVPEADRRLEGERLRHLRLLLADRLQVRRHRRRD